MKMMMMMMKKIFNQGCPIQHSWFKLSLVGANVVIRIICNFIIIIINY